TYNASGDRTSVARTGGAGSDVVTYVPGTSRIDRINKANGGFIQYTYDALGNRIADDDSTYPSDDRSFGYDDRNNLVSVHGHYATGLASLGNYVATFAYDERNRRIFKSFTDTDTQVQAQWQYIYDQFDRLIQVKHTPNAAVPGTFSTYEW